MFGNSLVTVSPWAVKPSKHVYIRVRLCIEAVALLLFSVKPKISSETRMLAASLSDSAKKPVDIFFHTSKNKDFSVTLYHKISFANII